MGKQRPSSRAACPSALFLVEVLEEDSGLQQKVEAVEPVALPTPSEAVEVAAAFLPVSSSPAVAAQAMAPEPLTDARPSELVVLEAVA